MNALQREPRRVQAGLCCVSAVPRTHTPLVCVCRSLSLCFSSPRSQFDTESEVLAAANNVDAGLAAYFWTQSPSRIWRMSEGLQYGMVGANTGSVSSTTAPFGGVKQSGFGREGSHHGLTDYLDIKAVHQGI